MNLRNLLLFFLPLLTLSALAQPQAAQEYLQWRKEEVHRTMDSLLHGYAEEMPGWLAKRLNEQSARLDNLTQYSKKDIALAEYYTGCFYYGHGDEAATLRWFSRAAQFGQPDAQFNIGLSYEHGFLGQMENLKQAIDWYSKAAAQGSSQAMLNLGAIYYKGKGRKYMGTEVKADFQKALGFFKSSAERENTDAMKALAVIYDEGKFVERNVEKAIGYWTDAAGKGEYGCYAVIGRKYLEGDGVKRNAQTAARYFRQGFDKGDPESTCGLAYCYYHGKGVKKDRRRAFAMLRAMNSEDISGSGCFILGKCYSLGRAGARQDDEAAAYWYNMAADKGCYAARKELRKMYKEGIIH